MLSDVSIRELVAQDRLLVEPFDDRMIQPASLDVRLDRGFAVPTGSLDPCRENVFTRFDIDKYLDMPPGYFALGSTRERITLPNDHCATLSGKSSLGRLGLLVHVTAGHCDAGFSGFVTLELSNLSGQTLRLWAGQRVGQLTFHKLSTPAEKPYGSGTLGSRYQGQGRGPQPSRSWVNFERDA